MPALRTYIVRRIYEFKITSSDPVDAVIKATEIALGSFPREVHSVELVEVNVEKER